jgi:peroxiredoxin Q/BCP
MLEIGRLGPAFALYNQDDHVIILDRLTSQHEHIVVYFFPQAGAPGCTREAIGFRDLMPEYTARGVKVVGITGGLAADLKEFARTNNLNFDVLNDPQRKSCDEWGALRSDNIARMTFVLNGRGAVTHIFPRVDVFKHPAELLNLFPAAAAVSPPAAAAQAAPAPASAPAGTAQTAAPAATATSGELIVATARAAIQLLLAHQQAGGQVPDDVIELAARAGRRPGQSQ